MADRPQGRRGPGDLRRVDPETRHARKSPQSRCDGYRAHVADGPKTGIITGELLA